MLLDYEVDVSFDPTALEFVSSANADYLPAGAFSIPAKVSDTGDIVKIVASSLAGTADGDGRLATVTFKVVETKASMIGIASAIIPDADSNPLEVTTADGMVTVAGAEPAPAEEAPAEEPAAEEAPAEEVPAEVPAAEEVPAEEVAPEMPVSQMFEITLTNLTTGEPRSGWTSPLTTHLCDARCRYKPCRSRSTSEPCPCGSC